MSVPFVIYWVFDPLPSGAVDRAIEVIERSDTRLAIQVRAKGAGIEVHRDALNALRAPAMQRGIGLFVNQHTELAVAGVGLHLSEHCPAIDEVRSSRSEVVIGASCHDAAGLQRRSGADFVVLGPVMAVPGKSEPLGWSRFAALVASAPIPVLALGGIRSPEDVARAREAGAAGVTVSRALEGDDAPDAVSALLAAWSY